MAIASRMLLLGLFVILVVFVGITVLEGYLARRESPVPGLVLPGLFLLLSLVSLGRNLWGAQADQTWMQLLKHFLFSNVPTLILLVLYRLLRRARGRSQEIDRMNIQDL